MRREGRTPNESRRNFSSSGCIHLSSRVAFGCKREERCVPTHGRVGQRKQLHLTRFFDATADRNFPPRRKFPPSLYTTAALNLSSLFLGCRTYDLFHSSFIFLLFARRHRRHRSPPLNADRGCIPAVFFFCGVVVFVAKIGNAEPHVSHVKRAQPSLERFNGMEAKVATSAATSAATRSARRRCRRSRLQRGRSFSHGLARFHGLLDARAVRAQLPPRLQTLEGAFNGEPGLGQVEKHRVRCPNHGRETLVMVVLDALGTFSFSTIVVVAIVARRSSSFC
mmetsp:Transcript_69246/g.136145  ORF Transcript_69246/g.136145 Transcript_69246/m.136145 type:complete len:280 (+) Transcript_69246:371-1210(+)